MQMIKQQKKILGEEGSAILISLFCISLLIYMACAFLTMSVNNYKMAKFTADSTKALWIAEAGVAQSIYDLREDYFAHEYQIKDENFAQGGYSSSIITIKGFGVHESLITSVGTYKNRKDAVGLIMRMATPTDSVLFFDGNAKEKCMWRTVIGGPIHLNGSYMIGVNPTHPTYYFNMIKSKDILGPAINSFGYVYRGDGDHTYGNAGVGDGWVSASDYIPGTGITVDSSTPDWNFSGDSYGSLNWDSESGYPETTYDFIFPTQDTPGGLIHDINHGGFLIDILTIRKKGTSPYYNACSFKTYEEWVAELKDYFRYQIDEENRYSKYGYITEDNWTGEWKYIVNDVLREKTLLGRGNGSQTVYSLPADYPLGTEVIGIGDGSTTTFYYYPTTRNIKNVYLGGTMVEDTNVCVGGSPVESPGAPYEYKVYFDKAYDVYLNPSRFEKRKVIFEPAVPNGVTLKLYNDSGWVKDIVNDSGGPKTTWRWNKPGDDVSPSFNGQNNYLTNVKNETGTSSVYYLIINELRDWFTPGGSEMFTLSAITFQIAPGAGKKISTNWLRHVYNPTTGKPIVDANHICSWWHSDDHYKGSRRGRPCDWDRYKINDGNKTIGFTNDFTSSDDSPFPPFDTTPKSGSYVCIDKIIKAAILELDNIDANNCPRDPSEPENKDKYGIIFSEVPLVIKGSSQVPVTIVCMDDIYVQSINSEYEDDASEAKPVGIISAKGIWADYTGKRVDRDTGMLDTDEFLNQDKERCPVILNKVALYSTRGDTLFHYGGRRYCNIFKLVGSFTALANGYGKGEIGYGTVDPWGNPHGYKYGYNDGGSMEYTYGKTGINVKALVYPLSFRGDNPVTPEVEAPPPHFPKDIDVLLWKSLEIEKTEEFMSSIASYIGGKQSIPAEKISELY